jgi:hypothetical protein
MIFHKYKEINKFLIYTVNKISQKGIKFNLIFLT